MVGVRVLLYDACVLRVALEGDNLGQAREVLVGPVREENWPDRSANRTAGQVRARRTPRRLLRGAPCVQMRWRKFMRLRRSASCSRWSDESYAAFSTRSS